MVFPLASLAGGALSPLQGLGFGFGYGYGVRLGYHSFKPSKTDAITKMRLSPNPQTAGVGMGLASAEEMSGKNFGGLTDTPTPQMDPNQKNVVNKFGYGMRQSEIFRKGRRYGLDQKEALDAFHNAKKPFYNMQPKGNIAHRRSR
jgi:hypothetical protein